MFSMISMTKYGTAYCLHKVDGWFKRIFKEQAGGAELIATIVIIGIVLILAFAFRTQLVSLVQNLWNNLLKNGDQNTQQSDVVNEWS